MRRTLGFALLAFALVVTARPAVAQTPPPLETNPDKIFAPHFASDPQGAIRRARERIAAGDLNGAVNELEIYVAAHPSESEPLRFLGDLYYRQGKFDKAELVYQRLLHSNSHDKETHNRLGVVYATENRVDDAITQFNAALPGTDSVKDLVAMHARKGDLPMYRSEMEALARSQPTDADIQAEVGQIYAVLHQPGQAMMYYMRALDSDPSSLTAINGLGLSYLDTHAYREAETQFKRCLQLDPTNYTCENNLGATLLQMTQLDAATPVLTRAHQMEPERPEALVNFGYLADARNDWKRAVNYYVQATVVGPYLPEAYVDLGIDYEHYGLYPLAQSALLKGAAAAPQDGRIRYLLAVAYAAQGQRPLAIEQLKLAEQSMDPDVARIAQEEQTKLSTSSAQP
jgi:tetratricopeptide (TPR) repeat protein